MDNRITNRDVASRISAGIDELIDLKQIVCEGQDNGSVNLMTVGMVLISLARDFARLVPALAAPGVQEDRVKALEASLQLLQGYKADRVDLDRAVEGIQKRLRAVEGHPVRIFNSPAPGVCISADEAQDGERRLTAERPEPQQGEDADTGGRGRRLAQIEAELARLRGAVRSLEEDRKGRAWRARGRFGVQQEEKAR